MLAGVAAVLLPNNTIKLGVLTDLRGFAADSTGPGSVVVETIPAKEAFRPIEEDTAPGQEMNLNRVWRFRSPHHSCGESGMRG